MYCEGPRRYAWGLRLSADTTALRQLQLRINRGDDRVRHAILAAEDEAVARRPRQRAGVSEAREAFSAESAPYIIPIPPPMAAAAAIGSSFSGRSLMVVSVIRISAAMDAAF